ncbi:MAG: hypothetical protein RIC19_10070 [Phaeodactylibacter sp.]
MKIDFTLILVFLAFGLSAQPVLVKDISPGDDASVTEIARTSLPAHRIRS